MNEPLFNNKLISIKGSPLLLKKWINSGILFIGDLYKNYSLLSIEEISHKTGKYPGLFLDFYNVYSSIPREFKNILKNKTDRIDSYSFKSDETISNYIKEALDTLSQSNQKLRKLFSSNDNPEICGKNFWRNKYTVDITDKYVLASHATKETRLRMLHFKILHNIYPSNILLHKMGIKPSDSCEFCAEKDVLEHLFIHCERISGFWKNVFQIIFQLTNFKFPITDEHILFGIGYNIKDANKYIIKKANHIILIAKLCISKHRYGNINNINVIFETELGYRLKP